MSTELKGNSDKQYYYTFSGAFRTKVREDHPEAIRRVNKNDKEVFEREVKALFGVIEGVAFEDSDYGKKIVLTLDANDEGVNPILSFGVETKDGRDILRKLPAVDLKKEVRIMPYRFTPEDKEISGISLTQQDDEGKYTVKIENFFFDKEKKEYQHNFPTIDWDTSSESEQKIYKITRDEFLVKYVQENICNKFAENKTTTTESVEYPKEEISPDDIPF